MNERERKKESEQMREKTIKIAAVCCLKYGGEICSAVWSSLIDVKARISKWDLIIDS